MVLKGFEVLKVLNKSILEIKDKADERLFAVGDIHGCYAELLELESKLAKLTQKSGKSSWRLISVGDLCDRGPSTSSVIEHFCRGKSAGTHELIIGNHEIYFLLAFIGLRPDLVKQSGSNVLWFHKVLMGIFPFLIKKLDNWKHNGGAAVFKSYDADMDDPKTWDKIPLSHIKLLFEAPLMIKTDKCILTHALAEPDDIKLLESVDESNNEPPLSQFGEAITRVLWSRKLHGSPVYLGKKHISGHTPTEIVMRTGSAQSIQIDTGAVYGNKLTALDLQTFRAIQIKSKTNVRSNSLR
jgi:serine/threonine protein phosphatase 1